MPATLPRQAEPGLTCGRPGASGRAAHRQPFDQQRWLADAGGQYDRVWFLGDLVGYGPQPNECVERLRALAPLALSGNHDWAVLGKLDTEEFNAEARMMVNWTRQMLTADNRAYLATLPPLRVAPSFTLAHASPRHDQPSAATPAIAPTWISQ